jgi:hypothetical protein
MSVKVKFPLDGRRALKYACVLAALLVPLLYFGILEWNPAKSAPAFMDQFFGADVTRVLGNIENTPGVSHYRDKVHPYFSLFGVSVAKAGAALFGHGNEYPTYKIFFGTLGVFLFWLYLYEEVDAISAFAAVALLLSTMTVRVWSTVPETFLFGFFTLMVALNAARLGAHPAFVIIVSFSGTITNVFFGLLYAYRRHGTSRELFRLGLMTAMICLILSVLQKSVYPTSGHFFDIWEFREEGNYVSSRLANVPFRIFDFLYSGFVLPLPSAQSLPISTRDVWLSFFDGANLSIRFRVAVYGSLGVITFLIASATHRFLSEKNDHPCGFMVFWFLCFQMALHSVYGDEPFLYSFHFLPLLIIFFTQYQTGLLATARPYVLVCSALAIQYANMSVHQAFTALFL